MLATLLADTRQAFSREKGSSGNGSSNSSSNEGGSSTVPDEATGWPFLGALVAETRGLLARDSEQAPASDSSGRLGSSTGPRALRDGKWGEPQPLNGAGADFERATKRQADGGGSEEIGESPGDLAGWLEAARSSAARASSLGRVPEPRRVPQEVRN